MLRQFRLKTGKNDTHLFPPTPSIHVREEARGGNLLSLTLVQVQRDAAASLD